MKHLPPEFWRAFNGEFPQLFKVGELLDGNAGTLSRTWREGRFDSMFDFPLAWAALDVFCRGESPAKLGAVLTDDRRYPDASKLMTLLDNHDLPRVMSVCGGDRRKVENALTFLFAVRGIPSIIWGTEEGFDGAKEPENRASMRFEAHPLKDFIARAQQQRAAMAPVFAVTEADEQHLVLCSATHELRIERGEISLRSSPQPSPRASGSLRRKHTFAGEGFVTGSGPELGDWDKAKALKLPVTVELPVGGVFEFKRIIDGQYEPGPNHVLFIAP